MPNVRQRQLSFQMTCQLSRHHMFVETFLVETCQWQWISVFQRFHAVMVNKEWLLTAVILFQANMPWRCATVMQNAMMQQQMKDILILLLWHHITVDPNKMKNLECYSKCAFPTTCANKKALIVTQMARNSSKWKPLRSTSMSPMAWRSYSFRWRKYQIGTMQQRPNQSGTILQQQSGTMVPPSFRLHWPLPSLSSLSNDYARVEKC